MFLPKRPLTFNGLHGVMSQNPELSLTLCFSLLVRDHVFDPLTFYSSLICIRLFSSLFI
jgi:hypothetical protein